MTWFPPSTPTLTPIPTQEALFLGLLGAELVSLVPSSTVEGPPTSFPLPSPPPPPAALFGGKEQEDLLLESVTLS